MKNLIRRYQGEDAEWWQIRLWPFKRWLILSARTIPYDRAESIAEAARYWERLFPTPVIPEGSVLHIPKFSNLTVGPLAEAPDKP